MRRRPSVHQGAANAVADDSVLRIPGCKAGLGSRNRKKGGNPACEHFGPKISTYGGEPGAVNGGYLKIGTTNTATLPGRIASPAQSGRVEE